MSALAETQKPRMTENSEMRVSPENRQEYLTEHIPYRLNSLRAWDLLIHRRTKTGISNDLLRCYSDSPVLDPAFEIAIVFGRGLLNFLGLTLRNDKVDYYVSDRKDDVQIWDIIVGKQPYPLSRLTIEEKDHLCNLIKVANKASAHLTTKTSSKAELDSLIPAKAIIYKMVMVYVDNLDKSKVWWHKEVER